MAKPALASANAQQNRGSIFLENAEVTHVSRFDGDQLIIRMQSPQCARLADPGSFVHIQCDEDIPMRRPLSIMRASAQDGWIEILFKTGGAGLRALGEKLPGDTLSIIGPIGQGFSPSPDKAHKLLIGGGVGIPPMIFLAERLRESKISSHPLVIMGSEIPFPFELVKSAIITNWLPDGIDSTMPLLEGWHIPARLASLSGFAGCYDGFVTDLSREWLLSLSPDELGNTEIFSCGPTPMLRAVADLASEFNLPCQVSLEEFMACAVGGCAGCTVMIETDAGPAMKRVCVDGPVFESKSVFDVTGA